MKEFTIGEDDATSPFNTRTALTCSFFHGVDSSSGVFVRLHKFRDFSNEIFKIINNLKLILSLFMRKILIWGTSRVLV